MGLGLLVTICLLVIILFSFIILGMIYIYGYKHRKEARPTVATDRYWDGKERRRFRRFKSSVEVRYEIPTKSQIGRRSLSRDVGEGGIGLAVGEKLTRGTRLNLQIDIPGESKPILAKGEVLWVREVYKGKEDRRSFYTGVKFIELSPYHRRRLQNYLQAL